MSGDFDCLALQQPPSILWSIVITQYIGIEVKKNAIDKTLIPQ